MMLAVCITTHNRPEVFSRSYKNWQKYMPEDSMLIVVDDASTIPCREATFRFDDNVGIARAKNKCLELADEADHIFLVDDDIWPTSPDWWKPYVESPEPHLMYIFEDFATGRKIGDSKIIYADSKHQAFSHPRGCMLYLERRVLDVVGGYDVRYGRWGHEHGDFSNRIYNNHLTSFRFADVTGSNNLFFSLDEHEQAVRSVKASERHACLKNNDRLYKRNYNSTAYMVYR